MGTLEQLLEEVGGWRQPRPGQRRAPSDWQVNQVSIATVRPLAQAPVPKAPGTSARIAPRLVVQAHPAFHATVRLTGTAFSRSAVDGPTPPALLTNDPLVRPFDTATALRSAGGALNVLELMDVHDWQAVTATQPLRLLAESVSEDECLFAVAHDGDYWLPVGWTEGQSASSAALAVSWLPEPHETRRTVVRSIRLYLYRALTKRLGLQSPYPRLAAAEVDADGQVHYDDAPAILRDRIARARRILLFLHGIFGDTRPMLSCVRLTQPDEAGSHRKLADDYDLLLAFDYENLNTPISDTARILKQQLVELGLREGHGKDLHLVAHSMGGLVARWLIEQEGGDRFVGRLVMLGTPNAGSPWPTVHSWAATTLALGLNGLTGSVWPGVALAALTRLLGRYDITLEQMMPDSELLRSLSSTPLATVDYTVIAGSTSVPGDASHGKESANLLGFFRRLLSKLSASNILRATADTFFFREPNDLAVSRKSMASLPATQSPAVVADIACDHLSYFENPASIRALLASLLQPGSAGS